MTIHSLNIGGGPKFKADGWLNLDAVASGGGFVLSPDCTLPAADNSLRLVYSSHTLEHLDDATVERVLEEAHRVLRRDGHLLIKIPDFDLILNNYERGDEQFFLRWPNIRTMTITAHNRGIVASVPAIAAQCFCGFWNKAFGDMFRGYDLTRPGAYYGPPVMTQQQYVNALSHGSPHVIAHSLRTWTVLNETEPYTFNHQNAWSRREFRALLALKRFGVIPWGDLRIIEVFSDSVPGLAGQRDISGYYLASPTELECD